jgi:hypothetical protein
MSVSKVYRCLGDWICVIPCQSCHSRPEHTSLSDGNLGCCWCVAAEPTGPKLNNIASLYTHNLCVSIIVILAFILDSVLLKFLEILYDVPSMTCNIMEAYKGDHLSNIVVYESENKQSNMGWVRIRSLFLSRACFMQQRWSETPQIVTTEWHISSPSFRWRLLLPTIFLITVWFILYYFPHLQ